MHWVLGYHGHDGPTQELLAQTGLRDRLPLAAVATDIATLHAVLARHPRPVSVLMVAPQDGQEYGHPHGADRMIRMVRDLCDRADAVVLMINEIDILQDRWQSVTEIPRLWVMAPAQHNFGGTHRPFVVWQHWIYDLRMTWQTNVIRQQLDQLTFVTNPTALFDVLLGGERPYRTQLHDLIESDAGLRDRVIMSYYGGSTARPRFILEPELPDSSIFQPMHTGRRIDYQGVEMRLACVPPMSIYRQTYFTVLTETSAHGVMNFYTEKVAKPLLAGRMFLAVGGQHYLRGLRDSGFQTFDPIIDESYDLEPNDEIRVSMVFREMQRLSQQDPESVLDAVADRIQHNLQVAWTQDFLGQALAQAQDQSARFCKYQDQVK
jgi:hypothetical protein